MSDVVLAVTTLVQLIEFLDAKAKERALEKMDLSDEGFKSDLDLVKKFINWEEEG